MTNYHVPMLYVAAERAGKSVFIEEIPAPSNAFTMVPGFDPCVLWGTNAVEHGQWEGRNNAVMARSVLPDAGATRLWMITFPPDSVMASPELDPLSAGKEYAERLPGLAERFEADNPGMHRTDTIDYDIVLDGEITIELDDTSSRVLHKGDVVVQYGVRHAWRNHTARPATLVVVMIGGTRRPPFPATSAK